MTLSWIRVKGPPLPLNPILLAGTINIYSNRAIPQLIRMIAINPNFWKRFHSENLRCPYQASVIKILDTTRRTMVRTPFINYELTEFIRILQICVIAVSTPEKQPV